MHILVKLHDKHQLLVKSSGTDFHDDWQHQVFFSLSPAKNYELFRTFAQNIQMNG
jgi:hypothetical protein